MPCIDGNPFNSIGKHYFYLPLNLLFSFVQLEQGPEVGGVVSGVGEGGVAAMCSSGGTDHEEQTLELLALDIL